MAYDFERPHRITSPGAVRLHSLCIPRELVTERGFDLRRMSPVMLTRDPAVEIAGELIGSILGRWSRITAESQAAMADALLGVLMPPLVRQIGSLRPMGHAELLRERALAFIAKNLDDPELGVGYIARVLGCTRRYLHMSFAETGTTASRTIWQMRLERARHSLSEPSAKSLSVTEIAFACGFSSSAHFSRLFKERFGCSPSQARLPETPG
jgi:AraC-like DNA-binding protein